MSSLKNQQQFDFIENIAPDYANIALSLGVLLNEKQAAYGNAFGNMGEIFNILYPEGISPHQYEDILTIARIMDKIFRIANLPKNKKDLMGEEPWKDIAGYALLALSKK
jgi:hypothetical protein